MTALKILESTPIEEINRLQNKVVEEITEYKPEELGGAYKSWIGSTETEYFSIVFMAGIIVVSCEEREILLGSNTISYAATETLLDTISKNKNNEQDAEKAAHHYNHKVYPLELEQMTLKEIMDILKWKFKSPNVKIKEGMIFLP